MRALQDGYVAYHSAVPSSLTNTYSKCELNLSCTKFNYSLHLLCLVGKPKSLSKYMAGKIAVHHLTQQTRKTLPFPLEEISSCTRTVKSFPVLWVYSRRLPVLP